MATVPQRVTEADLRAMPRDGRKYELVDGAIEVSPAGYRHGRIAVRLTLRLGLFVSERELGDVLESSTGFRLPGGNVRCPDVSFVAKGRVPSGPASVGFAELAPDLAVEVLSPDDDPRRVLDKVGEFLRAGARLVWVLDPERASAAVYRSLTDVRSLTRAHSLEGEDVLPGFTCPLAQIFD